MIKVLIADDHTVVRRGLALVLRQEPDLEIVAEAQNGAEALTLAQSLAPDVALLDWKMPELDGFAAARAIRKQLPATRTLVLSGAPIDDQLFAQLNDVDGYVHKDISPASLAHAVRCVANGERHLGPVMTQALLQRSLNPAPQQARPRLSPRELDVLKLMATPATYREIAAELVVSESTIHTYVKRIMTKLDQPNRTQAVLAAMRWQLI